MNILEVQVSYYKDYNDTVGVTTTLYALLTKPRHEHKRLLERIRAISDKKERDALKKTLPLFSSSAHLLNRNADVPLQEKLVSYSGFMQFDIDGKDNPGMNPLQVRDAMARIPILAYVALSASGRGVWGLIRIEQPERLADHYAQFKKIVHERTGIKLDTSKGGNPTDLRFISYDPDAKFNLSATPIKLRVENKPKPKQVQYTQIGFKKGSADLTRGDVEVLVNEIVQRRINLFNDYQTWFAVGTGFIKEFGSDGLEPFQAISQFYPTYDDNDTEKQYNSWVKSNTISGSIGTFFNVCSAHNLIVKELKSNTRFTPPKKPQEPPKQRTAATTYQQEQKPQEAPEPAPAPTSTTDVLEFNQDEPEPLTPGVHSLTNRNGVTFEVEINVHGYPTLFDAT